MNITSGMKQLAAALAIGLHGVIIMAQDEPAAEVDLAPLTITVSPALEGDFDTITVRIVAPNGDIVLDERSLGMPVSWSVPVDAEDGWYNYEAVIIGAPAVGETEGDSEILGRAWGQFRVEGGLISVPPPIEEPAPALQFQQGMQDDLGLSRYAALLLDWLIASATAQDLVSSSTLPSVFFDDTNDEDCTPSYDWRITTSGGTSNADINNFFQITGVGEFESGGPCAQDIPIVVLNHDGLNGATSSSINSIVVPANGDVNLANGSVYVDRSVNRLGIGTTTPVQELHIQNSSPGIRLDDPGVIYDIQESADDLSIFIVANTGAGEPTGEAFTLEDSNGFFGIWQPDPVVPLHVQSPDGQRAHLRVQNTVDGPATGIVPMLSLVNAGTSTVVFRINAGGSVWALENNPRVNPSAGADSGQFTISKQGGTVAREFTVTGLGDGKFRRNSIAVNHVNTSSRAIKTDFVPVDGQAVLAQLATLPISRWRYRAEAADQVHIGPMAEDFQTTFGLSDGEHISTVDATGVALAALKGLHQVVADKDAQIAALVQTNADLAKRLERLETLLLGENKVVSGH